MMHVGLGFLALNDGREEEAHDHFRRGLAIATNALGAVYDIVEICAARGFEQEVRGYAEELVSMATAAIASDPGKGYLYDYRALGYSTLGEEQKAERDRATKRSLIGWWEETEAGQADSSG